MIANLLIMLLGFVIWTYAVLRASKNAPQPILKVMLIAIAGYGLIMYAGVRIEMDGWTRLDQTLGLLYSHKEPILNYSIN
jgi:hypothetical protein